MVIEYTEEFACGSLLNRTVISQVVERNLSSDTGLMLCWQFDGKLGWTSLFEKLISEF